MHHATRFQKPWKQTAAAEAALAGCVVEQQPCLPDACLSHSARALELDVSSGRELCSWRYAELSVHAAAVFQRGMLVGIVLAAADLELAAIRTDEDPVRFACGAARAPVDSAVASAVRVWTGSCRCRQAPRAVIRTLTAVPPRLPVFLASWTALAAASAPVCRSSWRTARWVRMVATAVSVASSASWVTTGRSALTVCLFVSVISAGKMTVVASLAKEATTVAVR